MNLKHLIVTMKVYSYFLMFVITAFLVTGCIHFPSPYSSVPGPSEVPTSLVSHVIPHAVGPAPSHTTSPATQAIQTTFNWVAGATILGGLACLVFGGLAIYGGHVPTGVKLIVSGILLPVVGVWFAYHWGLVVLALLSGIGVYYLYQYWSKVRPVAKAAEAVAGNVLGHIESGVFRTSPAPTALTAAPGPTGA